MNLEMSLNKVQSTVKRFQPNEDLVLIEQIITGLLFLEEIPHMGKVCKIHTCAPLYSI